MGQVAWEADKMLDVYIYDYLVKRNLHATAKTFMAEGKVATDPVAIDAPGGFLFEWWSVFWDIFITRTNEKHSDVAAAYFETQRMKAKEKMQQYQQMQRPAVSLERQDADPPPPGGAISNANPDSMLGSSVASALAGKVYSEHAKNPNPLESEALKSRTSHPGLLVQGQSGTMPSALQQLQGQNQQNDDMKPSSIITQRSLPVDPSALYGQRPVQGTSGFGAGAGLNQGASSHAFLNGWPLQNIQSEQIRPSFGSQGQRPFLPSSNQYQSSQHQLLGQAHMQVNMGSSHAYAAMDPQKFRAMQRSSFNVKDGKLTGNDGPLGSLGSPTLPSSSMVKPDLEYLLKHSPAQRPQELLEQQHQLLQNNRKRKPASSGSANSSGTGTTLGPSSSQPLTPSTSTPGDVVAMGSNQPHARSMPKSSMMYGTDGAGGLGSCANQMDDLEHFGDIGTLDDNVESFLSNDEDARDIFAPSKNSPAEHNTDTSKGISEAACNQTSNDKVLCCHFSSDGTLLACAGHEKKVLIWNTATFKTVISSEEHKHMIADIRFRPDSTILATSSYDQTIRLWNAAESICHLHTYAGHSSHVTSLDFHPKKPDLLCSCDDNGEIWLWNVNQHSGAPFCKGGSQRVRFQPRVGQLLAAASEKVVSILDFETKRKIRSLQGHDEKVLSVCWDPNGEHLATVSHDTLKVWSVASGVCMHELRSTTGNDFHSCVFHPTHSSLLVIGTYQYLQLWDMAQDKNTLIHAHDGLITALSQSARSGYVASGSHDKVVKLWK